MEVNPQNQNVSVTDFSLTGNTIKSNVTGLKGVIIYETTSIDALPSSILRLDVGNNNLTSLPVLPSGLTDLSAYYNMLSVLPTLPSTLVNLDILGNPINSLPTLPTGLSQLNISSCDFTTAGLDGILDQLIANNQNSQAIGTVIMQTQSTGQSPTTSKVTALEALGWTVIV